MTERKSTAVSGPYDGEIDLRAVIRILYAGKWVIIGATVFALVISVGIALLLPNVYRAEALLAPNHQEGAGGLSALAAQYGGLASLAGISLGNGATDKTTLALEVLNSRKFIADFVERHNILVELMAAKSWNQQTGELRIDSDIYDASSSQWTRRVKPPKKTTPSREEAYELFSEEVLSVAQDRKTGFVKLAVEHYSPIVARDWANWLVQDINATIMRQEVKEAEQAIEYLNEQIASTSLADLQAVFFGLIEEQTKIIMLARVSPEYVFKTIDPAVIPEMRIKPRRSMIAALGAFLGGLSGFLFVFLRQSMRRVEN